MSLNPHHWNISLSKNCLFLTHFHSFHSNGKGDRLSALGPSLMLLSLILKSLMSKVPEGACIRVLQLLWLSACRPLITLSHVAVPRGPSAAPRGPIPLVAVPPGPMLLPLETPCCCPSKPLVLCLETPGLLRLETPGDKFWDQNFQVLVIFRPLRPKRAIPHPTTIQNMRFKQKICFDGESL